MLKRSYLEGAISYRLEDIELYTRKGWWLNLTFSDILDCASERFPEKTAVIDNRSSISYSTLKKRAGFFARRLLQLGVRKYDRILLQLPNIHEFLVVFYGAQRIGAVPVLAVPRHGVREISHFIQLTNPKVWVLPERDGKREFYDLVQQVDPKSKGVEHVIMVGSKEEVNADLIPLDSLMEGELTDQEPLFDLEELRPDSNDVALILLTGGTTGLPRGVPRTHNSFLTNIRYTNLDTRPDDILGLATPIGHAMAHQGAVGGSIFHGATLCLIAVPRARPILEAIERHRITKVALVPTQLEDILNEPDLDKYDLSSLKRVQTAGAALHPETARKARLLFAKWGAEFAGGGYGSSEGPCATHRPGESPEVFRNSIGMPMCEGDRWKAIDENEEELPPGIEGELAVKGPCVFTGYYRSDEENQKIFTWDGFYKTGDLGKIDENGYIYITGRKKDIIQRGAESIIPADIEAMLNRNPVIESSAVVAMPDPRLGEKACAYVKLKPGCNLSFEEMISFLRSQKASLFQLPERLEIVEELPRTPVGKIDKEVLRKDIRRKIEKEKRNRGS